MTNQTRNKMVAGTADLLRRRGVNATSVREVVRHSKTPRGSVQYHFPNGKPELVQEAILFARKLTTEALEQQISANGAKAGIEAFGLFWKSILLDTEHLAGCPILAVSVEQYIGEDGLPNEVVQEQLLSVAAEAFREWKGVLQTALVSEGMPSNKAKAVATLVVTSLEGAVAVCRACKSTEALDNVMQELHEILGIYGV